ncbi:MAG: hypothetical protein ACREOJ_20160 [Gemmatimonadaceae bacterium]
MRAALLAIALAALPGAQATHAQDIGDLAAYAALVSTPAAGLAPVAAPYMIGERQTSAGFAARYGRLSDGGISRNAFAADVTFPVGKGSAGLIAGYLNNGCDGCNGYFVAGAHADSPIVTAGSPGSGLFTVGVSGMLGLAKPTGGTALTLSADLPVAVAIAAGRAHVVPFIAPGFGFGRVSGGGDSESGTRFMLGGGVGLMDIAPGLGVSVGAKQVFLEGAKTVFGASVSWQGGHH